MTFNDWKNKGTYIDVQGRKLFCIAHLAGTGTPLAFLHGYPSASFDYCHVLSELEKAGIPYVIHDHLGFGMSEKPLDYSYSLIEQAELAIELWRQLGLKSVHIVSHDYGTTVANEVLVRKLQGYEPVKIESVTFCNGSMHIELAQMKLIQRLLKHPYWGKFIVRLMNKPTFVRTMRDIWYDKSRFQPEEMDVLWKMLMHNMPPEVMHKISQYNNERVKYWHRWIPALSKLDIPAHILWAQQDPIAVKAIAEQLHREIPNSVYTKIEQCGHYPMLEKPEAWISALLQYYSNTFPKGSITNNIQ